MKNESKKEEEKKKKRVALVIFLTLGVLINGYSPVPE